MTGTGGAIRRGFTQPYTAGRSGGYQEEKWHWSYWPVAEALHSWLLTGTRQARMETALQRVWYGRPDFAFVQSNWRTFVNTVERGIPFP
jgi:hypothetical protein